MIAVQINTRMITIEKSYFDINLERKIYLKTNHPFSTMEVDHKAPETEHTILFSYIYIYILLKNDKFKTISGESSLCSYTKKSVLEI